MKWKCIFAAVIFLGPALMSDGGEPMTFKEISMLVRNGEDQQYILKEAGRRKLLQPLSSEEIGTLVSEGATPALITALRTAKSVPPQAATAYAQQRQQQQLAMLAEQRAEQMRARQAAAAATPPLAESPASASLPPSGKPLDLKFTAADGSTVDLSAMRGKVVLVDFWATWCGPCMGEVPNVVAAYNKYHDRGFEVVGISLDKDKAAMMNVTQAKGMVWPQYFDGLGWQNAIAASYGIHAIPTMWLIDKNGMLANPSARGNLEASVEKLLAE